MLVISHSDKVIICELIDTLMLIQRYFSLGITNQRLQKYIDWLKEKKNDAEF